MTLAYRKFTRPIAALALAGLLLGGCELFGGEKEGPPLPGRRTAVLPEDAVLEPDRRIADVRVQLPRPSANSEWPQNGGYPSHAMHHLSLGRDPRRAWQISIGAGRSDERRLLAQPVVGGGRVYAMDSRARVSAFDAASGRQIWRVSVLPKDEDDADLGGGVSYASGRVYVSTGGAETLALDAASGKILWRTGIQAPSRAAPTVSDGRVYVLNVENNVIALNAADGKQVWRYAGVGRSSTILGGASIAASGDVIVAPLSSGDIVALRAENGRQLWIERLAAFRRRNPVTNIADITANPVIDRGRVYAVSNAGRLAAIDLRTGQRIWDVDVGSRQTPWIAGDYVFILTNSGHLAAITRGRGQIRWVIRLARFVDNKDLRDTIVWAGPVLASDRLIIAGSHGEALSVSPYTGEVIGWIPTGRGVRIQPLVANRTIYFLTDDGDLRALR